MREINLLTQETIDKIAAGEVVERPSSIVKELVENAIDAGATAVTVEIKEGGISFIRITDNGEGIEGSQVPTAFLRHATSKIKSVEDLLSIGSLGFRGEALSSIAAISQVELITKTAGSLTGCRYLIEGGAERGMEEIGAPEGSTFLVRNVFYNTPARKKFLKSPSTEAGYISDLLEHLALSHPEISFKFINNGQTKLHTSGNGNLKDIIYSIYGRDIAANLVSVDAERDGIRLAGFIGKPVISRGNRNFENYFVNGRYVKSSVIAGGIEEGYKTLMMQHRYPFTVLNFSMEGSSLDINVHPTKMELRFADNMAIYQFVSETVRQALSHRELIPRVTVGREDKTGEKGQKAAGQSSGPSKPSFPEPFEKARRSMAAEPPMPYSTGAQGQGIQKQTVSESENPAGSRNTQDRDQRESGPQTGPQSSPETQGTSGTQGQTVLGMQEKTETPEQNRTETGTQRQAQANSQPQSESEPRDSQRTIPDLKPKGSGGHLEPTLGREAGAVSEQKTGKTEEPPKGTPDLGRGTQMELFDRKLLDKSSVPEHRLIGQVFDTYWIVQFQDSLYIIDQHAAHEKVMYERLTASLKTKEFTTQRISPPIVLSLSMQEENLLKKYEHFFREVGFEIEPFGGREYCIRGVPGNFFGIADRDLFIEMLDSLSDTTGAPSGEILNERLASMACKSAVKGNSRLSLQEANALIQELLTLENPYNCPHGRPTIISMSKYELEKKFKRIV